MTGWGRDDVALRAESPLSMRTCTMSSGAEAEANCWTRSSAPAIRGRPVTAEPRSACPCGQRRSGRVPLSHRNLSAKLLRAGEGSQRQPKARTRTSSVPAKRRRTQLCRNVDTEIFSLKRAGRLGTRQSGPVRTRPDAGHAGLSGANRDILAAVVRSVRGASRSPEAAHPSSTEPG